MKLIKHHTRLSGENLTTHQMIFFHFLKSKSTTAFSAKIKKQFNSKENAAKMLYSFVKEINTYKNAIEMARSGVIVKRDLKDFEATVLPFLENEYQTLKYRNSLIKELERVREFDHLINECWLVIHGIY